MLFVQAQGTLPKIGYKHLNLDWGSENPTNSNQYISDTRKTREMSKID